MGMRVRLKGGFDISGYPPNCQVILNALKTYGMILADNGSSWYMSGAPDSRWNNDDLNKLKAVLGSNLEAVNESSLMDIALIGISVIAVEAYLSRVLERQLTERIRGELLVRAELVAQRFGAGTIALQDVGSVDAAADETAEAAGARITIVGMDGRVMGDSEVLLAELAQS